MNQAPTLNLYCGLDESSPAINEALTENGRVVDFLLSLCYGANITER